MAAAEELHKLGERGVLDVKRWLEATMRFEVLYTVYDEQSARITLPLLNAGVKRFDMVARHFEDDGAHTDTGRQVFVEVKNANSASTAAKHKAEFLEFAATAYSATRRARITLGVDPGYDFMFATRHPWDPQNFLSLTTRDYILSACEKHKDLLGSEEPDGDLALELATRLWVWIVPRRQDEMTMGRSHVGLVWQAIKGGAA